MPRTCTICTHPERDEIEKQLVARKPFRRIAKRFETSDTSLFRHAKNHLPGVLLKAREVREVLHADGLLEQVRGLCERTETLFAEVEDILAKAKQSNDLRIALAAVHSAVAVAREARGNAILLGQLTHKLQPETVHRHVFEPESLVRAARAAQEMDRLMASTIDVPPAR